MKKIYVIGGMAIDIEGVSNEPLMAKESNPGTVNISYGGVGRNITENLARLGADVGFISVVGDDDMGRVALNSLAELGVDVTGVKVLENQKTAMYLSIVDSDGEPEVAVFSMDVLKQIDKSVIEKHKEKLVEAGMVAVDTNLSGKDLEYILDMLEGITPVFIDCVSAPKTARIKDIIGRFHTIKANRGEAEVLTGIKVDSVNAAKKAARLIIDKGVKRVFLTMGEEGLVYCDGGDCKQYKAKLHPGIEIISGTGAGDCFGAVTIDSFIRGFDVNRTIRRSMAASQITLQVKSAVSPYINYESVEKVASKLNIIEG